MPRFGPVFWLILAVTVTGCGAGSNTPRPADGDGAKASQSPVDPATAGSIGGRVTFDGVAPPRETISMATDPNCRPDEPLQTETISVGQDHGLQNVFVYVRDGLGDLQFPVPASPAVLDQRGCRYTPRVIGVQVGQPVEILNSDRTFHNVHAVGQTNSEFNVAQPSVGMTMTHTFTTREVMVPFKCDVHLWMHAWVGVLEHPFFAVTGADGSFSLAGLPPGTYTVDAWHESLGTQTMRVTVTPKSTATASFTFKG